MEQGFWVTNIKAWLREKSFRVLFVLSLSVGLFLSVADYYEDMREQFIVMFYCIALLIAYGVLRLLCRQWPLFLQLPLNGSLIKAFLLLIIFIPFSFTLLDFLFGWLGWLDEQSWATPPAREQVGMHAMWVGLWYGAIWTPLSALLASWLMCRHPQS